MKKVLLLLLILTPLIASAQRIERSTVDETTQQKIVYTSWEQVGSGNQAGTNNGFLFRFRFENKTSYLDLKWVTGTPASIAKGAPLVFKFSNGATANLAALSAVKSGKATGSSASNAPQTIEATYVGDFALFDSSLFPIAFRLTMTEGYLDIDLKTTNSQVMNQSFQLLLAEIVK